MINLWKRIYKKKLILPFKSKKIISPVSGKIVFANYFKGYKNLLIIDFRFAFHVILSRQDEIYYKIGTKINCEQKIRYN